MTPPPAPAPHRTPVAPASPRRGGPARPAGARLAADAARRSLAALLALLTTLAACVLLAGPVRADDAGDGTDGGAGGEAATGMALTITSATAVVTASSGYQLRATITNHTDAQVAAGTATLSLNAAFIFMSRTDMQDWAQGQTSIPVPDQIGTADVPELAPGASADVSFRADADALSSIVSWGPKPLLLDYRSGDTHEQAHTFLTRSNDGLSAPDTPAMSLTVAMPLSSDSWQVSDTAMTALLADKADDTSAVLESGESSQLATQTKQLIDRHRQLQVIADPLLLAELDNRPSVNGVMQPAGFDITAYAEHGNAQDYADAGITDDDWSADTAHSIAAGVTAADAASAVYAWQGEGTWTMQSLTEARRQGYTTVITDHEFDQSDNSTVHTGTLVVTTEAGDITVLSQQRELGQLAQGQATSEQADSEHSDAGRLARFIAQSAFYQMEQPYTSRNLLICLSPDNPSADDALMSAIEQAPWLSLTSLDQMSAAEPYASGDEAEQLVRDAQDAQAMDEERRAALHSTLTALAEARGDITRFTSQVVTGTADAEASGDGGSGGSGDTGGDGTAGTSDAQALARQDAGETSHRPTDPSDWTERLLAAERQLALRALGSDTQVDERMVAGATSLAARLLGSVVITPSESLTVVSETATRAVTVSNTGPYPVHVQVTSSTDSSEIVTSRLAEVDVPARGEAQVTFTVRVVTSSSAQVSVALQDRNGTPFGDTQTSTITSVLQISDMSGFVIIGLAVLLGILGLWRQFHRKKDPDE